jgi:NADP-dependent 3-hydroxy acid dehydrogenase YdfG
MLNTQIYLITGAGGAVAKSIIAKFAALNATLYLLDRPSPTKREQAFGTSITADLSTLEGAQEAVEQILETHGRLDGVVHTIGGFAIESILEYKPSTYDQMLDSNLRSTVNIAAATTPALEQSQGFFGAIAAGQVIRGTGANLALYTAAKGAMALFIKSLAAEIKAVRYGVVYPMGTIDTPANRKTMPNADISTWIAPTEIAEALAYMATRSHGGRVQEVQVFPN